MNETCVCQSVDNGFITNIVHNHRWWFPINSRLVQHHIISPKRGRSSVCSEIDLFSPFPSFFANSFDKSEPHCLFEMYWMGESMANSLNVFRYKYASTTIDQKWRKKNENRKRKTLEKNIQIDSHNQWVFI